MPVTPKSHLGRYELIREVARSNDVVFEAWDPNTQRRVAIKALQIPDGAPNNLRHDRTLRFEREARAAARLHHPNIVTLFDYGTDQSQPFLVFEFVEGPTLAEILETRGALDPATATIFIRQILSALGFAHAQGVIHRDVKPSNIFVCPGDHLKITDLGIARIASEQSVTSDGQIFGTPAYMAPEQVKGLAIDQRVDIWAAGVVLYQMLTGVQPFSGSSVLEIGGKVVHDDPDFTLIRDDRLKLVLEKALKKDPAQRFVTAVQMACALQAPMPAAAPTPAGTNLPTVQVTPATLNLRPKRRVHALWAGATVLALAIGAAGALLLQPPVALPPPKPKQTPPPVATKMQAKSVEDVLSEAWEHNSLHVLATSDHFRVLAAAGQLDELDTWCRSTIGADYMNLDPDGRDRLLSELQTRFEAGTHRVASLTPGRQNSPSATTIPNSAASQPEMTFPGPPASSPTDFPDVRPPAPDPAPMESPRTAPKDSPASPGGDRVADQVSQTPSKPAGDSSPPANPASANTAPSPNVPEVNSRLRRWPTQRSRDLNDLEILRRLHFRYDRVIILPGGVREYIGPDGVVRIK